MLIRGINQKHCLTRKWLCLTSAFCGLLPKYHWSSCQAFHDTSIVTNHIHRNPAVQAEHGDEWDTHAFTTWLCLMSAPLDMPYNRLRGRGWQLIFKPGAPLRPRFISRLDVLFCCGGWRLLARWFDRRPCWTARLCVLRSSCKNGFHRTPVFLDQLCCFARVALQYPRYLLSTRLRLLLSWSIHQ